MQRFESKGYYVTPSELRSNLKKEGVANYSPDFLLDLATHLSGQGKLRREEDLEKDLRNSAPELFPREDGSFEYQGNIFHSQEQFKDSWVKTQMDEVHKPLIDYIQSLPETGEIPGSTPLNKALNLVKQISNDKNTDTTKDEGGEGGQVPSFNSTDGAVEQSKKVEELCWTVNKMQPCDGELLKMSGSKAFVQMPRIAQDILRVEQSLRAGGHFSLNPRSKWIKEPQGEFFKSRSSRGISDLRNAPKRSLLLRGRLASELIMGNVQVAEKYRKDTSTSLVTMIMDVSGSMDGQRSHKALGILYHLVKEAALGNCVLLFSFFETKCYEFHLIDAEEMNPISWFREVMKTDFDGSTTDVRASIRQALTEIERVEKEEYHVDSTQKHLVVVNDGADDTSGITLSDLAGSVLHAYILDSENPHIGSIARASGGQYKTNI